MRARQWPATERVHRRDAGIGQQRVEQMASDQAGGTGNEHLTMTLLSGHAVYRITASFSRWPALKV